MLFHFHNPTCAYNHLYNPHQNFSSTNFHLPILHLLVHKIILAIPTQSPLTLPSSIPQHLFTSLFLLKQSLQSTSKLFSLPHPFSHFRLRQSTNEQESLSRTNTVLISVFLFKVLTEITGLTITDSLLLRLRKLPLIVLQVVISDEDACNQN